jgi:hypothetical protein
MKLRYMIDCILKKGAGGPPVYEPVGVWVQGPGPGLDLEMFYRNSREAKVLERKEEANWVLNRLVEAGVVSLPEDFLDSHRRTRSPYDGAFGEIVESGAYPSLESCGRAVLGTLSPEGKP